MKKPWLKFFPTDWRQDPALRMCSLAARGLWIEMLCLMWQADPCGSLLVNGKSVTPRMLAPLIGATVKETTALFEELKAAGVFSIDEQGVVFSRRIRNDIARGEKAKAFGGLGGNPKLKPDVNGGVNPYDKVGDKTQILDTKPEARSQKPDPQPPDSADVAVRLRVGLVNAFQAANCPTVPDTSRAEVWLAQGYKPDLVLAVIKDVLASNNSIRTLAYFDPALERARSRLPAGGSAHGIGEDGGVPRVDFGGGVSAPHATIRKVVDRGEWLDIWGPKPGEPGCRIADDLLAEIMGRIDA